MICVFFKAKKECIPIVIIITTPPIIVCRLGCSLIITHTQIGPNITSSKKNKFTSGADINLGAIVTKTNGIATHITHINGMMILSVPNNSKFSTKKNANIATTSFPITAEGTKSTFFAYRAKLALMAKPKAVIKPKTSPKIFPNWIES